MILRRLAERLTVHVRREVLERILAHARAESPFECCGLVLGRPGKEGAWPPSLEDVFAARNLLAAPTRFQVDPEDHFAAIKLARSRGQAVLAAYHSHPASPAVPSPRDLAEASDPDLLYLIASLPDAEVRAYRLRDGNFHPVVLVPFS